MSNQIQLCEGASYSCCAQSWHQQTYPSRKKVFHWVENVIKQLVHTSAVCSLRYEVLGKFREHSRVALSYTSSNSYASFVLSKLPHASYLNECMLTYEPIVTKKEKKPFFQFKLSIGNLIHSLFCFLLMEGWLFNVWHHLKKIFFSSD